MSYTHLHIHTDYSVSNGIAKIRDLLNRADQLHLSGLAITDHGTMAGVPEFLYEAGKHPAIKPIAGCEFCITDHFEHTQMQKGQFHIILLAKNLTGYHNLVSLSSIAGTEGMYCGKPRISHRLLEEYREGLICTSACLGGEIPQIILKGEMDAAREAALWYKRIFGEDFYLEVWNHRADSKVVVSPFDNIEAFQAADKALVSRQRKAVKGIYEIGKELGIKVIATNDVHFVLRADAVAHDALLCISTGKKVGAADRLRYSHMEFLRSEAEMRRLFRSHPEAIDNTQEILDKVERYSIAEEPKIPYVSANPASELRRQVLVGAANRYGELDSEVLGRIEFELSVIDKNRWESYFLIWKEVVDWARSEGIAVGPGRGSAAGSIVNYCLGITGIDPLKNGLLFERFLNPDKNLMPDIDVDFEQGSRKRIVEHLADNFGRCAVSYAEVPEIFKAQDALISCAEVYGANRRMVQKVSNLCEQERRFYWRMSLRRFRKEQSFVDQKCAENEKFRAAFEAAEILDGIRMGTDIHSSAIIVGAGPLSEHIPMAREEDREVTGTEVSASQYRPDDAEECGVLRLDILGIKVLSIIRDTVRRVKKRYGVTIDIDRIPIDDVPVISLFADGCTDDIFQFDSEGMRESLRELRPDRFSDLVAMNALYRPGPLDKVSSFIARKNCLEPIAYILPEMEEILGETYGLIVYQEQIMEICKRFGGFAPGEADRARKAFGKCRREVLDKLYGEFASRGVEIGHVREDLARLWKEMEASGLYAFNKSHALCYTWIAWQCAWLKVHYPVEYAASYSLLWEAGTK